MIWFAAGCGGSQNESAPADQETRPESQFLKKEIQQIKELLGKFEKKLKGVGDEVKQPVNPPLPEEENRPTEKPVEEKPPALQKGIVTLEEEIAREFDPIIKETSPAPLAEKKNEKSLGKVEEKIDTPLPPEVIEEKVVVAPEVSPPPAPVAPKNVPKVKTAPKAKIIRIIPRKKRSPEGVKKSSPAPSPQESGHYFDLGLQSWHAKDLDKAIQYFLLSVRAEPMNAHAYWNLAIIHDLKGQGLKAIEAMEKAKGIYQKYDRIEDDLKAREKLRGYYKKYVRLQDGGQHQ
jgi:tetratricopeptide (TPR) repeat protein